MPDLRNDIRSTVDDVLFDTTGFGISSTYTPASGPAIEDVNIIVEKGIDFQPSETEGQIWENITTVACILSDVTTEPSPGATFLTTDGDTWTIKSILSNDGFKVVMEAK